MELQEISLSDPAYNVTFLRSSRTQQPTLTVDLFWSMAVNQIRQTELKMARDVTKHFLTCIRHKLTRANAQMNYRIKPTF